MGYRDGVFTLGVARHVTLMKILEQQMSQVFVPQGGAPTLCSNIEQTGQLQWSLLIQPIRAAPSIIASMSSSAWHHAAKAEFPWWLAAQQAWLSG